MGQAGSDQRGHEFVRESLAKWTPRFIANGIDANDLRRLEDRIDDWTDWCHEFGEIGAMHADLGEAAEERGDHESAGGHFTQAAMYYHFGSHVWHEDDDERDAAHRRAVELFERGGQYLDPPLQRLEAPTDAGFAVPATLRVPAAGPAGTPGDSPLVLLLPGSDSIKEELDAYGTTLLGRGLATLAVDGAGQGETWHYRRMTPDYYELISAVIDHVRELDPDGVDTSRIGVYGVSLGGFYAAHVAANDDRVDACVGLSGKFTVGPATTWATNLHEQQYAWACKADSMVEVDEITEAMTLRDDIANLTAPALMVTGANDTVTPPAQTRRIAERAPNGEFVCFEDANHVCNDITYKVRPLVADWLRRRLT